MNLKRRLLTRVNLLSQSGTIWRHKSGLTLLPDGTNPYECWIITNYVLRFSSGSDFTRSAHRINSLHVMCSNSIAHLPGANVSICRIIPCSVLKYDGKGTSSMTSQWGSRPTSALLAAAMRSSNTVFMRWFMPDKRGIWNLKAAETFQNLDFAWAWDKFATPCLRPRIREFIHT